MHQLSPGRISEADGFEDRPPATRRPWKGWPGRAYGTLSDVPSGDEHGGRLRTGSSDLGPRAPVDALGRQDEGTDLRADEGSGTERRPEHRRGRGRAHEGGAARS